MRGLAGQSYEDSSCFHTCYLWRNKHENPGANESLKKNPKMYIPHVSQCANYAHSHCFHIFYLLAKQPHTTYMFHRLEKLILKK